MDGDSIDDREGNSFNRFWGWFAVMVDLAQEDITKIEKITELLDFINFSIKPALVHSDSLSFDQNKLTITTMGHSTNEMIVEAMLKNIYLTHISMTYSKWEVGGKFTFVI